MSEPLSSEKSTPYQRGIPRNRWVFRLLTVAFGVIVGVVITEIALRAIDYSWPEFYQADQLLGYSLIPNMSGMYRKEGKNFVTINGDGFHDAERSREKAVGTVRIAVIGDSYVEAFHVGRAASFPRFVQDELSQCGAFSGRPVEILSFGVSGYGTAQELLMLRERVWKYSPDIVMLLVTTTNDVTDNSRYFKHSPIPYFVFDDNTLRLDDSFTRDARFLARNSAVGRLGNWLKNNVRFVQAISEVSVAIKYRYGEWKASRPMRRTEDPADANRTPFSIEVGIEDQTFLPPSDANWENAWLVTEAIIQQMKTEVEERQAKFIVVTGSHGVQVLPDAEARHAYEKLLGVDNLFYADMRIADFCRSHSIEVITLAPALASYAERENVYLHGFEKNMGTGHWNTTGHRVAGTEIGRRLCEFNY